MNMHADCRGTTPARCVGCPALTHGFCANLSGSVLQEFSQLSNANELVSGDEVVSQDKPLDVSGNVKSGVLKFTRILPDGREFVSQLLYPGDMFHISKGHADGFALVAATDAEVCLMDSARFLSLAEADQAACEVLLTSLGEEVESVEDWIVKMGTAPVSERIAYLLHDLWLRATRGTGSRDATGGIVVEFPVPRGDLVAFLGTSQESMSRQLQHLARTGVIRILNGREFAILSPERLADIAAV